ncbi:unnamed protein product [Cylicocyclus nassatus]|uniref:Nematode cuticle collagen N-terminal domain-containing protein n=1 Tax=Cylicocyclus nassatus TaxID=53992 RepID=A0AA36H1L8_CYLNA|nr:unnamed protein product [Cylicocyclus nassatus]
MDHLVDLKARVKAYRLVAYAAVAFSAIAVLSVSITLPLVYKYVHHVKTNMHNEIVLCRGSAQDIWSEVRELRTATQPKNRTSRQAYRFPQGAGAQPAGSYRREPFPGGGAQPSDTYHEPPGVFDLVRSIALLRHSSAAVIFVPAHCFLLCICEASRNSGSASNRHTVLGGTQRYH